MKVLHVVSKGQGTEHYKDFSRWQTTGELAVYGPDGELVAVYAEGVWSKAFVTEVDEWQAESV